MADLSERFATGERGERAQLILIGGFALAVTLIALALVMNSAIYTENLATRSEAVGPSNAHAYQRATTNAATEAFHYAHDVNNGTYADLDANVTDAMEEYNRITTRQEVTTGRVVNTSVDTTRGTNISASSTNFDSPTGSDDWTLATSVSNTRKFSLAIEQWDDTSSDEFRVVADSPDVWYMNVSYDSGVFEVGVNNSGTYTTCQVLSAPASDPDIDIDLSGGTVNGNECGALDLDDAPGSYNLRYENGTQVMDGHYSVIVDSAVSSSSPPRTEEVLYSMTVEVVYETNDMRYRTDVRIAPGEEDA